MASFINENGTDNGNGNGNGYKSENSFADPKILFKKLEKAYLKSLTYWNTLVRKDILEYYKTYQYEKKFGTISMVGVLDEYLRKDYPPGWKDRNTGVTDYEKNPVLLIHGYGQNRGAFTDMADKLREQGFSLVYRINHNPFIDIKKNIKYLKSRVQHILEQTTPRSGKVDLIGHSLGGLTARYYSYLYPEHVDYCMMIGAPNHGTYIGYVGLIGFLARLLKDPGSLDGMSAYQMTPGSKFLNEVNAMKPDPRVKYINIYTGHDELIIKKDSEVVEGALNINVMDLDGIDGIGHAGLIHDPRVIDLVCEILSDTYEKPSDDVIYEDYDDQYHTMIPVRESFK